MGVSRPGTRHPQARALNGERPRSLLHGVSVGIKDVIDTCDMPTERDSPIYKGRRPAADAACVALLRRAGCVILGKCVTTEFAYSHPSHTRNPHNPAHTPGGSSIGSAAAVADRMVPLALTTHTGGSTIRPAAFCGITGCKPSFNTVNRAGLKFLAESFDTIGAVARSSADALSLIMSCRAGALRTSTPGPARMLRVGLCRRSRRHEADPDARREVARVADVLALAGCRLSDFAKHDEALFDMHDCARVAACAP